MTKLNLKRLLAIEKRCVPGSYKHKKLIKKAFNVGYIIQYFPSYATFNKDIADSVEDGNFNWNIHSYRICSNPKQFVSRKINGLKETVISAAITLSLAKEKLYLAEYKYNKFKKT